MADVDDGAQLAQLGQQLGGPRVAARHRHASLEQDPGDAGHSGAADADEVHPPKVGRGDGIHELDETHR